MKDIAAIDWVYNDWLFVSDRSGRHKRRNERSLSKDEGLKEKKQIENEKKKQTKGEKERVVSPDGDAEDIVKISCRTANIKTLCIYVSPGNRPCWISGETLANRAIVFEGLIGHMHPRTEYPVGQINAGRRIPFDRPFDSHTQLHHKGGGYARSGLASSAMQPQTPKKQSMACRFNPWEIP